MNNTSNIIIRDNIQQDVNARIANAWCAVATKFTSAIAGHRVQAGVSSHNYAPAWSDESSISFSKHHLPDLSDGQGLVVLKGLTWHELAHVKYTARKGSPFITEITKRGLYRTFNLLEDARIEMLLVKRYSSDIADWLVGVISTYLLANPDTLDRAFPLIHGRKYLPADVRSRIRQAYVGQDHVVELGNLIDEFLGVSFPRDTDRAVEIVQRVHDIMKDNNIDGGCGITHGSGGMTSSPYNPDPDAPTDDTDDLADSVADDVANEQGDEPTQTSAGKPSDSTSDSSDDDESDESDESGDDGDESSDSTSDESGDDSDESDAGSGHSDAGSDTTDAISDILSDVLNDVLESLNADIADIREQILGQDSGLDSVTMGDLDSISYSDKSVGNVAIDGARDFGSEMEQLKLKHDPAWQFEVDSGRLNVVRVVSGCEPDRAFDVFQDGNDDATQIESVVCLDISGSMGNIIQDAYRAMYQIKAGLETVQGASCSVLTYNGETNVLYRADEPAGSTVRDAGCGGGTDGEKAVRFANNILAESDKAIKLLFVICDGDLSGVESYVAKMRQAGVMTVLAWVGGAYSDPATAPHFNFEVVASANTPTDLVSIARRVVNLAVERKVGA